MTIPNRLNNSLVWSAVIVLAGVSIYYKVGIQGYLQRDSALYLYAGQQMARGVPPYVSTWDVKGPAAPIVIGLMSATARGVGVDELYLVRVLFAAAGCICPVLMYFLGRYLFQSESCAVLSGFVFLSFPVFSRVAANGPFPKVLVIACILLSLLFTCQRRWFWAGVAGSLAALTWQPTAVFGLVTIGFACISDRSDRMKNVSWAVLGLLLPAVPIAVYLLWTGGFGAMFDQAVYYAFFTPRDTTDTVIDRMLRIYRIVSKAYPASMFVVFLSVGLIVAGYIWRVHRAGSLSRALFCDRFAPILLTFPAPILWSLVDFNGSADFFIFLPYISLAVAKFLDTAIKSLVSHVTDNGQVVAKTIVTAWVCIALWLAGWNGARQRPGPTLAYQKAMTQSVVENFGSNVRMFTLGRPDVLVFLKQRQHEPFLRVNNWIARYMERRVVGGFEGWLEGIRRFDPEIILVGDIKGDEYGLKAVKWVEHNYQAHIPKVYQSSSGVRKIRWVELKNESWNPRFQKLKVYRKKAT